MNDLNTHINQIVETALDSINPSNLISDNIKLNGDELKVYKKVYPLNSVKNVYVVGAGKASGFMAHEIEKLIGDRITGGVVSVYDAKKINLEKIKLIEGGHPIPNENSLKAGKEILEFASKAKDDDLVICLLSGGGSALMESLPTGISLEDFSKLTNLLIKSGADINEVNTVRKSLSKIKGGKLAAAIAPAQCISLLISDVVGDNLASIASGPTEFSKTKNDDALNILNKYELLNQIPAIIKTFLEVNEDSNLLSEVNIGRAENFIIGNNRKALAAAKSQAEKLGYEVTIVKEDLDGEANTIGKEIAAITKDNFDNSPICLLFGGETTVTVRGTGKGGRNQQLVLAALEGMKNVNSNFIIASFGTDGRDGPTDAAGAYIDQYTWQKADSLKLEPAHFLVENNSYEFFDKIGQHIKTGSTGTNVADITICLLY